MTLKSRIDRFLHEAFGNEESYLYWLTSNVIVGVTMFSIVVTIIDYESLVSIEEIIVTTIFIIEYAANIYVTKPARKYILSWRGLIDFLAIAPSLITWIVLPQLKVARGLRMARFVRLMRVIRIMRLLRFARVLKLAKDAGGDTQKHIGVAILGIGVVILAVDRGFRATLSHEFALQVLIVGGSLIGIGNLIYIMAIIRSRPTRNQDGKRVVGLSEQED